MEEDESMSEEIKHYTAHWHTSPYPLMVGFGSGLFLPWAFMMQFNYEQGLIAVILLGLGALLTIIGGIGWAGETIGVIDDEGWSPSAMFMFIGTEIMTIGGILMGYWTARLGAPVWPPEGTPAIEPPLMATIILVLSSFTIGFARKHEINGNASGYASMGNGLYCSLGSLPGHDNHAVECTGSSGIHHWRQCLRDCSLRFHRHSLCPRGHRPTW